MIWFMAIPEEGTYEEMKRKLLALTWGYDLVPQEPPQVAEVWSHLLCAPDWRPAPVHVEQVRAFEQMRQYAMQAGKAIVFKDGTFYDAERHVLHSVTVAEELYQKRRRACWENRASEGLL